MSAATWVPEVSFRRVEAERDEALAALARVRALVDGWDDEWDDWYGEATNALRAALDEPS